MLKKLFISGSLTLALLAPNFALADAAADLANAAAANAITAGATAAGPGIPTTVVGDAPAAINKAKEAATDVVKKSYLGAVIAFLINVMSFAADKAAYDAAVLIASGGNGDAPLVEQTPIESYFSELGLATAGQAVGLLNDQIKGPGSPLKNFDLCAPSSNPVLLSVKLGIKSIYQKPKPKCEINKVVGKWKEFTAEVVANGGTRSSNVQEVLGGLAKLSDPGVSEFSVTTGIQSQVLNQAYMNATAGTQNRLANGDFKAVTDFITKKQETPASMIKDDLYIKNLQRAENRTAIGAAIIGNSDAIAQIGIHAGSLFVNTLLSALTEKLYSGFFESDLSTSDPFNPNDFALGDAASARSSFRSLLAAAPLQITNFSILADFSACPQANRGLYNCVADNSFIAAISRASSGEGLTIAEAMDQGLLRPDWPLIPSGDQARNQDPYCYTYGYCHSNLVKLRKARVISVGWEFAADAIGNSPNNPVTLREVVEGFDDCDPGGQPSDEFRWCKLIDPNWVLKYPETQCRAAVNGQLLTSSASNQRQTECVDMPSCIAQDEAGNCTGGYGYCVREENIWRFRGQSCPAQFASCITVKNDEKTISYLRNTTDSGPCTEDNAGCTWYATQKVKDSTTGAFSFPAIPSLLSTAVNADLNPDVYQTRTYFTSEVEDCEAAEGGCRQLITRDDTLRLNMLINPSFDRDADRNNFPDGWQFSNTASSVWSNTGTLGRSGPGAVTTGTGIIYQTGVEFSQSRFYTVSFYARRAPTTNTLTNNRGSVLVAFGAEDGSEVDIGGTSLSSACTLRDGDNDGKLDMVELVGVASSDVYQRFSCTFTSPTLANPATRLFAFIDIMSGTVYYDDLQIEQGEDASPYHEGYSSPNLALSVVKVAPSYLGCTGAASDPAECAKYAKVCTENDVGCRAYTPVNGDPVVTGVADFGLPNILDGIDECPQVCSGYDTYKQEPTRYEPSGLFPLHLIPKTARTCTQQQVGCDEFTNLSDESKSYFTYIRACLTPAQALANTSGDNAATFYTWEGSDTSGFQLKTWNLLESNMGSGDYDYANSSQVDTAPDKAPCSHFTATASGLICADSVDLDGDLTPDWDTASCDEHADIFRTPNCREFYDADGNIHYRDWSNTVTVDAACANYRKTDIAGVTQLEKQTTCNASGGYFDTGAGTCRYNGFAPDSTTCTEAANGCRSYTGGRSRNSRVAFTDLFERDGLTKWTAASAATVTLSNESLANGGHSISATAPFATYVGGGGITRVCLDPAGCLSTGGALGGNCVIQQRGVLRGGGKYCGSITPDLAAGKTYTLSFWAKGTGTLATGFDYDAIGGATLDANFGTITLTSGWQEYALGPLNANATGFGPGTALAFRPSGSVFVDNIVLREGQDNITLIKNSWVTPAICDQSPNGAVSPQYYLGCQEYKDSTNQSSYLKSFSKLCSYDKVGCQSYFMTQESSSPHAEIHNATCGTLGGGIALSATACHYQSTLSGITRVYDTTSPFLCTIGVGFNSCTFNLSWYVSPEVLANNPATAHLKFAASTVVTPADKDTFLVVTPQVTCNSSAAGCTEYGLPTFNQSRTATTGATSVYLKNNPAAYGTELCTEDALFCSAWTGTGGTAYYFKDPGTKTCEYRTDVRVGTVTYDGWFKTGTSELCYNSPAYVVGGNLSGIWKNGDAQYQGWVGTCANKYDSCSEFQDPLDVTSAELYGTGDGQQYFSLASSIGTGRSASASAECNGKVSLKEGCGLFNNTSTAAKTFNASATEIASRHADTFFNDPQFSLVDPINCAIGSGVITLPDNVTTVDLCANRCIYSERRVKDITERTSNDYLFGGSCYNSADCPTIDSESGEQVTVAACGSSIGTTEAPRLTNDSNQVLKVNRDRQCSEWLSCADAQTVWDERTNSYKTICGDIGLCTEYSSQGNSSFCSQWNFENPLVVLDAARYTSRDITWYGDEYSGLAVPNIFPVETLSQANVVSPPGKCELTALLALGVTNGGISQATYDLKQGDDCTTAGSCGLGATTAAAHPEVCPSAQVKDFRLVLNAGSCTGQRFGSACTVGTCSLTGATCTRSDDCGNTGGTCIVGQCLFTSTTAFCTADADCSASQFCNGGLCAQVRSVVTSEVFAQYGLGNSCDSFDTFIPSVGQKTGTCVNDACLLAPDGQAFAFGETEGKSCRAYPETTSPFSADLVKSWFDSATQQKASSAQVTIDDVPYETVSGFDRALFCAPGEDCICTYKKVTYGSGTAERFYSRSYSTGGKGICSGGPFNGLTCQVTLDCATAEGSGICVKPTREDTLLGMDGYCLERDSGININGDRDQNACVTWLPVDQLAGSSDLYGKYTSAGWADDLFYCAEVKGYSNVAPMLACSQGTGSGVTTDNKASCKATMDCPAGFFAVGGPANKNDGAGGSVIGSSCVDAFAAGKNGCPYLCVPYNSFHAATGAACGTPTAEGLDETVEYEHGTLSYANSAVTPTEYYFANETNETAVYEQTDLLINPYKDCVYYGAKAEGDELGWLNYPVATNVDSSGPATDFKIIKRTYGGYPACEALLQAGSSDAEIYNAVWTDRLLHPPSDIASIPVGTRTINRGTDLAPFGHSLTADQGSQGRNLANDPTPAVIPACVHEDDKVTVHLPTDLDNPTQCEEDFEPTYGNADNPAEAQSFLGWDTMIVGYTTIAAYGVPLGGETSRANIVNDLRRLFAAPMNLWKWSSGVSSSALKVGGRALGTYAESSVTDEYGGEYEWDDRSTQGNPPTIWAVDPSTCRGTECEEGPSNALTLNDQNTGEVSSAHFLRANLKFYAAADKNQLPIRRVIVDWGDNSTDSGSPATDNFYKNHRGLQDGTNNSICDTNAEWGMTPESCDPNYFTYTHIYTCPSTFLLGYGPSTESTASHACSFDSAGNLRESPCVNVTDGAATSCSFQPRTHVRDNWGWCTGTCSDTTSNGSPSPIDRDSGNGVCFEGTIDTLGDPSSSLSECAYLRYPSASNTLVNPWVYYDGIVTVNP